MDGSADLLEEAPVSMPGSTLLIKLPVTLPCVQPLLKLLLIPKLAFYPFPLRWPSVTRPFSVSGSFWYKQFGICWQFQKDPLSQCQLLKGHSEQDRQTGKQQRERWLERQKPGQGGSTEEGLWLTWQTELYPRTTARPHPAQYLT